jgi:hypothetical protein
MNRLRNASEENLLEELNGRHGAINHLGVMGGMPGYANFHRNQIRAIKSELARRWRNQAVAKNRARKNRKAQATVKKAANFWMERTIYRPGTNTSPAGSRAARALSAHIPHMTYAQVQSAMRAMNHARLVARRARTRNASTSMSPSRSTSAKTRRT